MLQVARKASGIALLALGLCLAAASAQAQTREFTGKVDGVTNKKIIIDNRQGDKVSFEKTDGATVEGEKKTWEEIKKGDWATVEWKFTDKPRKAYKVIVLPPREEGGEEVE